MREQVHMSLSTPRRSNITLFILFLGCILCLPESAASRVQASGHVQGTGVIPRQDAPNHPLQDETLFLPVVLEQPLAAPTLQPTPTPTPTPEPRVFTIPCENFPDGPSDVDWLGCVDGGAYEMQRRNVSFSMAVCCGLPPGRYAVEADAQLVRGEGDYRLGFDLVSLADGGGYLFGVNPNAGTYSLVRVDSADWKGGVPLINWTPSPHIRQGMEINRLRVERNQAVITLFINDQEVASLEDSTYLQSGVFWGLYVRNYSQPNSAMQFSRIRLYA